MENLVLQRKSLIAISKFCSDELIDLVFTDLNRIGVFINETNVLEDRWDVTEFMKPSVIPMIEKAKFLYVFQKVTLSSFIYKGEEMLFVILGIHSKNDEIFTKVLINWLNQESKGNNPFFDVGNIEI